MARNPVQFQKGISLNEFLSLTEPKTSALMPSIDGVGRMDFYVLIVATTKVAN